MLYTSIFHKYEFQIIKNDKIGQKLEKTRKILLAPVEKVYLRKNANKNILGEICKVIILISLESEIGTGFQSLSSCKESL